MAEEPAQLDQPGHESLDMIEEITRNDGTRYMEIGNTVHNGRAEYAAEHGFIKEVRILKLNIPESANVIKYEDYINHHFLMQGWDMTEWQEWLKTDAIQATVDAILAENQVS
ncbi:hypothetical protein ACRYI5_04265 [Furfurilactobacillus sp. WILCCON 0119]|uniref:hypothetical protein n=1 Tax=Furfurilactobacillus entadae TaxID=2922307 RepID=UPI0035E79049